MQIPKNLEPDTIWANKRERVYVLRVGKSKNIRSSKLSVDYYVPGLGEKWLELSAFIATYSFLGFPRICYKDICSSQNLQNVDTFTPRLL